MESVLKPSIVPTSEVAFLSRKEFPEDFVFGCSASAFQYEGAHDRDGKGVTIWDKFLVEYHPELVEKDNALEAVKHYDHWKDDLRILKDIGVDTYRFSICWPRLLPNGRRTKGPNGEEQGVNKMGIDFYNGLINELINIQIEPVVCLFHWDLPQALEDEYLGFLDDKVVEDYCDYADLCFREFGDRVKKWFTFNETWTYAYGGYITGYTAPGRGGISAVTAAILPSGRATSNEYRIADRPAKGEPWVDSYTVAHNQLLSHAAAVKLYRNKYQKTQNGKIGTIANSMWTLPYNPDSQEDKDAGIRAIEFMLGWIFHPLTFGDYPKSMRTLVGDRLPKFTPSQAKDIKGSFDILGLNYYTTNFAQNNPPITRSTIYNVDSQVICYTERDGIPIGEKGGSDWLYSYPDGLKELLLYIAKTYNNPPIYITENGIDEINDPNLSLWEAVYDYHRISYHSKHLSALKTAIGQGANVKGYFAWSLLDNLEGSAGFHSRFGLNYVHFGLDYERFPKLTAGWYKFFLQK